MSSTYNIGDRVIVRKVNDGNILENDVISYKYDDMLVTHRLEYIVYINREKHLITKGDSNESVDEFPIPMKNIIGKVR